MFKRFVMGLILGMAGMHWYIHSSAPVIARIDQWFHGNAAKYTDERTRDAADSIFANSER